MNENQNGENWSKYGGWGGHHWRLTKILKIAILLLVLWAIFSLVSGKGGANAAQNTITVTGKGEVIAKPDIATVDFSVLNENLDVSKASDAVNTQIAAIVAKLKDDGVSEDDIKTTDYSVYPQYNYVNTNSAIYPGGTQVLAGYDVSQSVEVKIRDLSEAGKIITDLGALKVTNLSGLNFTNDKEDDLTRQARDEAIADARSQAGALAKALGVKLSKIVGYSEGGSGPIYYAKAVPMAAGTSANSAAVLPTGENTIDASVSITYEIE